MWKAEERRGCAGARQLPPAFPPEVPRGPPAALLPGEVLRAVQALTSGSTRCVHGPPGAPGR